MSGISNDAHPINQYMKIEKQLAELLGWTNIFAGSDPRAPAGAPSGWLTGITPTGAGNTLPQWARDWAACGRLMTEYDAMPDPQIHEINQCKRGEHEGEWSYVDWTRPGRGFTYHPDKDSAVRFAIVEIVINMLTEAQAMASAVTAAALQTANTLV
jgi:hypothetical protein